MLTLTPRASSRLSMVGGAFEVREHRASRFLCGVCVLVGACSVWVNLNGDLDFLELQNICYLCLSSEGREGRSKR